MTNNLLELFNTHMLFVVSIIEISHASSTTQFNYGRKNTTINDFSFCLTLKLLWSYSSLGQVQKRWGLGTAAFLWDRCISCSQPIKLVKTLNCVISPVYHSDILKYQIKSNQIKFIKSRRTRWSLTPPNIIQIVCSKNKWHST